MFSTILHAIGTVFKSLGALALENLALRQQLTVLQRSAKRQRLKPWHRAFWVLVSRIWNDWQQVRDLIRKMSNANPTWGAPRIHGELRKLGIGIGQASVSKYMPRGHKPPSQTWRKFLTNHAKDIVSIDLFTVPTATFRVLFVFLVSGNERRKVIHLSVTDSPTAFWTGQQVIEAFPRDTARRFMIRDRDAI